MARALIVGCGCRGRALGAALAREGWAVRGTTRREERLEEIAAAGLEPALADPERPGTVLDHVADVTVLHWLLGSAQGEVRSVAATHGPRLESLLAKLVDTPVRGFVYEERGAASRADLDRGVAIVREAGERWRIRFEIVTADPDDHDAWLDAMVRATAAVLATSD